MATVHLSESGSGAQCRFCGNVSKLFLSIRDGEGLSLQLETKISRHLPVHLSPDDGLPQTLCYLCVDIIETWDTFVNMCIDRDAELRSSVGPVSSDRDAKEEHVYTDVHWDAAFSDSDEQPLILSVAQTIVEPAAKSRRKKSIPKRIIKEEVGPKSCTNCGKEFKDRKYAEKHEIKCGIKAKKMFPCESCKSSYISKVNLERHMRREHYCEQEQCPVCKESVNRRKLHLHLKTKHSIKREPDQMAKFKCKFCPQWFTNKYTRNEHVKKIHTEQETVKCEQCEFEGLRHIVKRHARSVHCQKRFPCTLCSSAFKTMHMLKMHMTAHSDMRSYTCDVCGMGFKRLNNVRDHMKCHQKKSNQCQICGNFFARKRYLTIHEQTIHNHYADGVIPEEKGFECGTCGAKLKWKKNLLAHMRIHTGEKPYDCKICHRGFVCHGSLRAHMAKHSVATDTIILTGDDPLSLEMSVLSHFNQNLSITHPHHHQ